MNWHRRKHNFNLLIVWIFLAVIFFVLFYSYSYSTGCTELDGLIGVCLGLFISSQPAANLLDLLLLENYLQHLYSLNRSEVIWLILNLIVLLTGLVVIIFGTKLFFKNWQ